MDHDPRLELMQRCCDGLASPDEIAELEAELTSDEVFRRQYLSYVNIDQALASGRQENERADEIPSSDSSRGSDPARTIWRWDPLGSAAAGVVIGFFFASIAWAVVGTTGEPASPRLEQLLFEESFESAAISWKPGFPIAAGEWGGDRGEIVLDSTQPAPDHGAGFARMEPAGETSLSYLTRIIEVGDLPRVQADEMRQLEVFSSFHADERGLPERYTLRVATFAEAPRSIRSLWAGPAWPEMRDRALTLKKSGLSTDGEEIGWQTLSAVVEIPDETRCVVISLAAGRLDAAAPKSAHYVDDVQANMVIRPQPTRPKRKR
ncbi:MAG: hypothetical protein AAF357_03780 [Verrucomicrobiota bacterium]